MTYTPVTLQLIKDISKVRLPWEMIPIGYNSPLIYIAARFARKADIMEGLLAQNLYTAEPAG